MSAKKNLRTLASPKLLAALLVAGGLLAAVSTFAAGPQIGNKQEFESQEISANSGDMLLRVFENANNGGTVEDKPLGNVKLGFAAKSPDGACKILIANGKKSSLLNGVLGSTLLSGPARGTLKIGRCEAGTYTVRVVVPKGYRMDKGSSQDVKVNVIKDKVSEAKFVLVSTKQGKDKRPRR